MKHLRLYEKFVGAMEPEMITAPMGRRSVYFETETSDFLPTKDTEEGSYIVNFSNAEGEGVSMVVSHAIDPEYVGNSMISSMEMIPDSSSDGREYSAVGYYDEIPGSAGAYELRKVLIEG